MLFVPGGWAFELPRDVKVTRIVGFDLESKRPKICGKNSRLDVHGDRGREPMIRVYTDSGVEGLGVCRANQADLRQLLGKNPFDFFKANPPGFASPLGTGTMPLWDLAGKILNKPVFSLLGGKGPDRVPVYDGSIYFADLLPEHASRWQDRFKEEIDQGLKRGHRAFKIKVGRGAKWMPTEEGFERDLEVVKLIRKHVGPKVLLGADANNGYDLARAKRFLAALPGVNLAYVEELFEEHIAQDLELKAFIKEQKLTTLIADGETQPGPEPLKPFMAARAIDIYQGDVNRFGIEGIMKEALWAEAEQSTVAPHVWGSLVGYYVCLQIGRAIPNFYTAERDPLESDLLLADGYAVKEGFSTVPEAPGFGLKLDEQKFASAIRPKFDLTI
jgi:L-alanine-DL-glutamate epimerase-like enolase superfamily enzyme